MEEIKINQTTCIHCGQCAAICPVKSMRQDAATKEIALVNQKAGIRCGQWAAICAVEADLQAELPASKLEKVKRSERA